MEKIRSLRDEISPDLAVKVGGAVLGLAAATVLFSLYLVISKGK